jgi:hypothetical protein
MPGREVAQFGSALRSGRRGRGFKSPLPDPASRASVGQEGSVLLWGASSRPHSKSRVHSDRSKNGPADDIRLGVSFTE